MFMLPAALSGAAMSSTTRLSADACLAAENSTSDVETDGFWALHHVKLPAASKSVVVASSPAKCRWACLNKRSCTAYAVESGYKIWNGDLVNLKQLSSGDVDSKTPFLLLAASEVPISKSRKGIIAGIAVCSVVGLAAALAGVLFLMNRYERQRKMAQAEAVARGSLVVFGYRNLQSLTKNFSEKLGDGGFGSVFRGTLPDLTMVAVKRLEGVYQGEKQFRAEVSTIGTIQHVNLIRLRGFSSDGDKKLLVYDYMPNGSLNSHLFGTQKKCLDWSRRYHIAIETARGLAYLHEKCRDCIIHCDIKSENILLDDGFGKPPYEISSINTQHADAPEANLATATASLALKELAERKSLSTIGAEEGPQRFDSWPGHQ
ncbi:hypothetical protein ACLOJK_020632 [Asimina triloba]